jgi:hypothetical protein
MYFFLISVLGGLGGGAAARQPPPPWFSPLQLSVFEDTYHRHAQHSHGLTHPFKRSGVV